MTLLRKSNFLSQMLNVVGIIFEPEIGMHENLTEFDFEANIFLLL